MKFQADKKHVSVTGRTIYREGIRYLGYSATSISFKFVGTKQPQRLSVTHQSILRRSGLGSLFIMDRIEILLSVCA